MEGSVLEALTTRLKAIILLWKGRKGEPPSASHTSKNCFPGQGRAEPVEDVPRSSQGLSVSCRDLEHLGTEGASYCAAEV